MATALVRKRSTTVVSVLLAVSAMAAWILSSGYESRPLSNVASQTALSLPAMDGEMCQWAPSSAGVALVAAVRRPPEYILNPSPADAAGAVNADRAPLRVIRDTYPTYSAVAVNTNSDEVFLQDENLFGLKVFNRMDNTPPHAGFTEPKRVVGGSKTKMEYNCGLYIDPQNGDVYSLSNDTVDTLVVFPHDARGNVAPMRELATPQATFAIAVDEEHQELFITSEQSNSVVVYRKIASGKEPPLRELIGDSTHLGDPHGIAVDVKNNLLFVNNSGYSHSWDKEGRPVPASGKFGPPSITVFPLNARGDTAPLRVIEGPKTQLNWSAGMYLDPEHAELFIANDSTDSILVFRETDSGDVAPLRVLKGTKTGMKNPTGVFLDAKNQELWVSNMGNHTATVYSRTANGDVAPLRTIRSAPAGKLALVVENPGAVGYDTKREQILVPN